MRKHYLDNIRWITVVLVVFYHVVYMYNAEGIPGVVGSLTGGGRQPVDVFQYLVYPWIMPILFIVSGICSRLSLEHHTDREFLRNRTVRLLVPSTIGLFAFQFIQGYFNMSLSGALEQFAALPKPALYPILAISGIGVLWYIQLLWVFSVVLIPVRKLEKDRLWNHGGKATLPVLLLMTVLVWAAAQILNTPLIVVYRFGFYGLFFFLGYWVFSHEEVIGILKKWFLPLLLTAVILGILFAVRYFGENYADVPINRSPLFAGFGWFGCLAILGGMARYGDLETPFTRWMSRHSFGLYVFHYLGISAVGLLLGRRGLLPAPAVYLITLAAGFLSGYGLNAVLSRLPFFRWAVLGIRKKEG